ncbi:MAG: amidohydrolase family protein [Polyangiales bacterium]
MPRRHVLMRSLALTMCLWAACAAPEKKSTIVSGAQAAITVLRNLRLVDGLGSEPVPSVSVVIEGERIRWVGPDNDLQLPPSAAVVELRGMTIMPALISAHSHVGLVAGTSAKSDNGTRDNILHQLRQYEAYGVDTVTSLGFNGSVFYELQPELHAGKLPGADLFGADRGIGVAGGAPPVEADAAHLSRVDTPEQARAAVSDAATRHPDLLKIWVDDFHASLPTKMKEATQRAVIEQAHELGLRVAAHVYYREDAKALVRAGVDILAHGVRDQAVDDELIALLREHGTWYVPTLGLDESFYVYARHPEWLGQPFLQHALSPALATQLNDGAWREKILADSAKLKIDEASVANNQQNLKRLYDAGVAIGFGTDSGATPLRVPGFAEHRELELMVAAGIPELAAIRIATSETARLLQLQDRGALAPGQRADFIILKGDPSRAISETTSIEQVWHRGHKVSDGVAGFTP